METDAALPPWGGLAPPIIDGVVIGSEVRVLLPPRPLWVGLSVQVAPLPRHHRAPTRQLIGLAVCRVSPDSPASRAGLRARDILLSVDGETATFRDALSEALRRKREGDAVAVTYLRRRSFGAANITLAARSPA